MSDTGLRIIRLQAENVKRLRAVEIVPDPNGALVIVSGANNQGKSSVLDSIMYALAGGRDLPGKPIRDGEAQAFAHVELGDTEPRLVVHRSFTAGGNSYLTVTSPEGAKFASPQKMLDELIGRLSFDPLEFSRLSSRERRDVLRGVADIPVDLDALEARRAELYDLRRDRGRELKRLEGALAMAVAPADDTPDEEVPAGVLATRLAEAQAHNGRVREAKSREADLRQEIEALEQRLAAKREQLATTASLAAQPFADVQALQDSLQRIEQTNAAVRQARAYKQAQEAVRRAAEAHQQAEDELAAVDRQRADALELATFPVEGLSITEDDVTYQGLPFDQLSSSQQLRISLAMAMALNPRLKVIRITDGSLLDSQSMAVINEMAGAAGFQVWMEVVSETGNVGIVIEDGAVKA